MTDQDPAGAVGDTPPVEDTVDPAIAEKAKKFEALEAEAKEANFDSVDEYMTFLADRKYEGLNNPGGDNPPPPPAAATPPPAPSTDGAEAKRLAGMSYLENQHTRFEMKQANIPEEQKTGFSKSDLTSAIMDPDTSSAIGNLSKNKAFDGNLYAAADWYLSETKKLNQPTPAEKANKDNLAAAADAGKLPAGTAPPPPAAPGEVDPNDAAADEIIEDDPVYTG